MLEMKWENVLLPGFYYVVEGKGEKRTEKQVAEVEDALTGGMILALQAKDEERLSEDLEEAALTGSEHAVARTELSMEKLQDFNYLLSTYYTVDSTTTIGPEQLNASEMLSKNMKLQNINLNIDLN